MKEFNFPCCYYPTRVAFIDDHESFLDSVLLSLEKDINPLVFTNPLEAVEYLKNDKHRFSLDDYLSSFADKEEENDFNYNILHSYLEVDLIEVHKKIYNANRFNEIFIAVVDYSMPNMNGIEVCKKLKEQQMQFIMLTGHATEDIVINAFNEGLISRYFNKSSGYFVGKLNEVIHELQYNQFKKMSEIINNTLYTESHNWLNDIELFTFFENFIKEHEIVEYYIANKSGCFLMADINGKLSWFIIKNENTMREYSKIATENNAPTETIKKLRSREEVLFLLTEEDNVNIPVSEWNKYMHPAKKLSTQLDQYYYAWIEHDEKFPLYNIFPKKITSFKEHLIKNQDSFFGAKLLDK